MSQSCDVQSRPRLHCKQKRSCVWRKQCCRAVRSGRIDKVAGAGRSGAVETLCRCVSDELLEGPPGHRLLVSVVVPSAIRRRMPGRRGHQHHHHYILEQDTPIVFGYHISSTQRSGIVVLADDRISSKKIFRSQVLHRQPLHPLVFARRQLYNTLLFPSRPISVHHPHRCIQFPGSDLFPNCVHPSPARLHALSEDNLSTRKSKAPPSIQRKRVFGLSSPRTRLGLSTIMAYPDLSDSERRHRYPQHLTSGDSADRPRSNSMSDTTNSDQGRTGSGSSYVHVERSDVESYQNSLYAGEFDYSESSASWDNLQSGSSGQNVAARDASGGQHTDCTRGFEPGYRRSSYQTSNMYAGPSDYNPHTQYAAPIGLPSQGLAFAPNHGPYGTQPLYNLQDDIGQTYPALTQGDDTMSPYRAAFGQVSDGRWTAVYQQAERRQHLDQQVNHLMDVLDPAGVQAIARSNGYASDTSSMSFDDVDDQGWGGASVATIRPENGPQNAPVDYSNGSQYSQPLAGQARFQMPPNRAVARPARQTSLAIRNHPRMA